MINRLDQVSVTEIGSFRECRRRWYWKEVQGYVPKTPDQNLWFGTLIHAALQEFAVSQDINKAIAIFEQGWQDSIPGLQKGYGQLWSNIEELFFEFRDLGKKMLQNYAVWDSTPANKAQKLQTVAVEQRVWVPIRTQDGKRVLKGSPRLTARMDRIIAVGNDLYQMDYKTGTGDWIGGRNLDLDDQFTGYNYIYWRLTGELFAGVFLETLLKKVPNVPRINKNGDLSTDKNQGTLAELYWQKMKEMGLTGSAKHRECYDSLKSEGWEPYFRREMTQRNLQQVMAYEEHLFFVYRDMRDVVLHPEKAYPNFNWHCRMCPLKVPCLAKEDGSDYQHILDTQFTVNLEKRW